MFNSYVLKCILLTLRLSLLMSAFLDLPRTAIFGFSLASLGISGVSESESSGIKRSFFEVVALKIKNITFSTFPVLNHQSTHQPHSV